MTIEKRVRSTVLLSRAIHWSEPLKMTFHGLIGDIKETWVDIDIVSIEWRIPNFLSLTIEMGDRYQSPYFSANSDGRWCFQIYPKGLKIRPSSDLCDLFLYRVGAVTGKTFDVTVSISGAQGVRNKRKLRQEFSPMNRICCWIEFCSRLELSDHESGLTNGNALIIALDIKCEVPKDASIQTIEEAREDKVHSEGIQSLVKKGAEKALDDLGKLLASGEKSDVTVQVGDVHFKVHSAILYARCPALTISLQHECREKVTNKIIIEDFEPDVFQDFLHYLYQGSAERLSEKNVFSLYKIADKYLVDDLKQQCLEYVQDTLSVQTFCDAVRLSLLHGQTGLLERTVEFASKNIRSIIRTVEWQIFSRDYNTESNEILIKALGPED